MQGRADLRTVGAYRAHADPMQVVSGPLHAPKVHFEAPPSATVPAEMAAFSQWFNATNPKGAQPLPALARAGLAHLYFESIHPFEDGNGRIGRAIAEKALMRLMRAGIEGFVGGLSASKYMALTGAPAATARRDLGSLVELGALRRTGRLKGTRYWLPHASVPDHRNLYSLYDALVSINVPADKARAVVDAMERDMMTQLASKSDVDGLRRELHSELSLVRQEARADIALLRQGIESGLASLRKDMDQGMSSLRKDMDQGMSTLRKDMTIWLGSAQILGMGLLFAALKLT